MTNGDQPRKGSQVLIVDPDERRREELRAALAPRCPFVRAAADLGQALIELRELPRDYPSVVLLDFAATNGKAEQTAAALRSVAPADLLVIVLSSLVVPRIPGINAAMWRTTDGDRLHSAIGSELTGLASRKIGDFVVVLLAVQRLRPAGPVVTGGTGGLVQIGGARFLLTAAHVARELSRPDVNWIMGGNGDVVRLPTQPTLLGVEDQLDIAAVALPDDFDPAVLGRQFYSPTQWPPARAAAGEVALFVGFPGEIRCVTGDQVNARGVVLSNRVEASSVERFILNADEDAMVESNGPQLNSFGGVSGAPVFASRERGLTLIGVINQSATFSGGLLGADGTPVHKGVSFFGAHGEVISSTGALAHLADLDI